MADNRKIRDFVERWTGRGYEKGEAVSFWKALLYALLTLISLSLAKARSTRRLCKLSIMLRNFHA